MNLSPNNLCTICCPLLTTEWQKDSNMLFILSGSGAYKHIKDSCKLHNRTMISGCYFHHFPQTIVQQHLLTFAYLLQCICGSEVWQSAKCAPLLTTVVNGSWFRGQQISVDCLSISRPSRFRAISTLRDLHTLKSWSHSSFIAKSRYFTYW